MNSQEIKTAYNDLYGIMANSNNPANMEVFGKVMTKMFNWFADNKPDTASEWLQELSSIKWDQFLTHREAENIVNQMKPNAPWSFDQWKSVMEQHQLDLEEEPYYNKYALYVTMNMVMSDSSETIEKYVNEADRFNVVYELALDKLCDADHKFMIREYFKV